MQDKLKKLYRIIQRNQLMTNLCLLFLVFGTIYYLFNQKNTSITSFFIAFEGILNPKNIVRLAIIILLIPINWAFEAKKWQYLAQKIEKITFFEAYKGVLAGLALSTATPLMAGDYAAKILLLKNADRSDGLGSVFLGNIMQLFVSVLFGTAAYLYFLISYQPSPANLHFILILLLIVFVILFVIFLHNLLLMSKLCHKFSFFKKFERQIKVVEKYKKSEIYFVFILASLRYFVFTFQFVLAILIFNIHLNFTLLFCGVAIVFLFKTIVPFINFLSDFGVRQVASLYYFSFFGVDLPSISAATTFIWLINIVFPMLIGAFFILRFQYTTPKTL